MPSGPTKGATETVPYGPTKGATEAVPSGPTKGATEGKIILIPSSWNAIYRQEEDDSPLY